jgi:predicted secreted Zn-dependent protease
MRALTRIAAAIVAVLLLLPISDVAAQAGEWQAVEHVKTYRIAGRTGIDLYASIGARGPLAGKGRRVIAHTAFKLTWTRDYQRRDGGCVLASARPHLVITTTLPKPAEALPTVTQAAWDRFIAGVSAHERVHGVQIKAMVEQIEAASIGLSVAGDADCSKVRAALTKRLAALSAEQRRQSRDFDLTEMRDGGTIQQLVLALVNGG